jgi:nitroreductase
MGTGIGSAKPADTPDLAACVRMATLAPSIHNSQPWRFRIRGNGIDVFADWRRRLDLIDPNGRQLIISVGAAILNLRLAIYQCGQTPVVRLPPGPDRSEPVAIVDLVGSAPRDSSLDELAMSMPRRHTNRQPFVPDPIPHAVVDDLVAAARLEGATLCAVPDAAKAKIVGLIHAANARLRSEGVYRAELAEWTRPRPTRRAPVAWRAAETLPLRDFGIMMPHLRGPVDPERTYPAIFVLTTDGDASLDWVGAGQAMERVWLTAVARGLAIAPMSQPLEIPTLRQLVTDSDAGRQAQVVLLIGYAPPTTPTPRRGLDELLVDG